MKRVKKVCIGLLYLVLAVGTLPGCWQEKAVEHVPADVPTNGNKMGVHLLLDDGRNQWPVSLWPEHMDYARDLVGRGGYVTELVRLDDLDVAKWQLFFDLCARLELVPILRLATTYDTAEGMWLAPPEGAAEQYAEFVAAIQWPSTPHYVIVGNEPNHGEEWGGRPEPAEYARFLLEVSAALRRVDPAVRILNAPLDPFTPNTNGQPFVNGMVYLDAESFMDGMVAAEPAVFSAIDLWASHAYPLGPLAEPPWQQVYQVDYLNGATNPNQLEPPAGIFNRGVNGYEWELLKLENYGVRDLPVMITETGWRHAETADPAATDNGREWPTAETVAGYVELAMDGNGGRYPDWPEEGWVPWQADPRVLAVTFFGLNGNPAEWGHTNWLEVDGDGEVLGSYWGLRNGTQMDADERR